MKAKTLPRWPIGVGIILLFLNLLILNLTAETNLWRYDYGKSPGTNLSLKYSKYGAEYFTKIQDVGLLSDSITNFSSNFQGILVSFGGPFQTYLYPIKNERIVSEIRFGGYLKDFYTYCNGKIVVETLRPSGTEIFNNVHVIQVDSGKIIFTTNFDAYIYDPLTWKKLPVYTKKIELKGDILEIKNYEISYEWEAKRLKSSKTNSLSSYFYQL